MILEVRRAVRKAVGRQFEAVEGTSQPLRGHWECKLRLKTTWSNPMHAQEARQGGVGRARRPRKREQKPDNSQREKALLKNLIEAHALHAVRPAVHWKCT